MASNSTLAPACFNSAAKRSDCSNGTWLSAVPWISSVGADSLLTCVSGLAWAYLSAALFGVPPSSVYSTDLPTAFCNAGQGPFSQ